MTREPPIPDEKPVHWVGSAKRDFMRLPAAVRSAMGYALGAIYVLHAFQKKSPSGRRTAQFDVALVRERLKRAREDYEGRIKAQKA
jgi:phage-related protein